MNQQHTWQLTSLSIHQSSILSLCRLIFAKHNVNFKFPGSDILNLLLNNILYYLFYNFTNDRKQNPIQPKLLKFHNLPPVFFLPDLNQQPGNFQISLLTQPPVTGHKTLL